jgi:hypothetical protein
MSGIGTFEQQGMYATKGTPSPLNTPGSRLGASGWIDPSGHLWLLGGFGFDLGGSTGNLNDLWMFDGTNWTWVSGSDTDWEIGTYGTKGTPAAGNVPGARNSSVSFIDISGRLWLFGGGGFDGYGNLGSLNDLWRWGP